MPTSPSIQCLFAVFLRDSQITETGAYETMNYMCPLIQDTELWVEMYIAKCSCQ